MNFSLESGFLQNQKFPEKWPHGLDGYFIRSGDMWNLNENRALERTVRGSTESEERRIWVQSSHFAEISPFLIWVDEAGRGPWAGPVVAGACALKKGKKYAFSSLLKDSKKLSPKKREEIFVMIQRSMEKWECFGGVGVISSEIIDQVGIREANRLAMQEAMRQVFVGIGENFQGISIDGRDNYKFEGINQEIIKYIIRGDGFIPEIQAASILAKVSRDYIMENLAKEHPEYWVEKHKWYGTRLHEESLKIYGPCEIHRKSYAPIKKLILGME